MDVAVIQIFVILSRAGTYSNIVAHQPLYKTLGLSSKVRLSVPQKRRSGAVNELLNKRRGHEFFVENRIYFYMKIFRQR
jgi:hypothetical protein